MRDTICILCVAAALPVCGQRVLHFTATSGYDHGTREVSWAMFTALGDELGVHVVNDPTGAMFSDPSALSGFTAVIFSNTSGNNILNASQRANFEAWVNSGGHVMGIHAASDTYRHSTANGNNTGSWDFYAELIGASVQENPNHVNGTPAYEMTHIGMHASTANLSDPWSKNEEYYYWENGYFGPDNDVVLEVEATVGPNGQVNSYDAPRPMNWYRTLPNESRVFYTALGHATSNYTDDPQFRQHVKDALEWLLNRTTGASSVHRPPAFTVAQNGRMITISMQDMDTSVHVVDGSGRLVYHADVQGKAQVIDTRRWAPGPYHINASHQGSSVIMIR